MMLMLMRLLCCDVWKWRSWKLSALCNRRKKQNPERDKAAVCWMPHRDIMFDYALQQWGRPAFASFKEAEGGISRSVHHHPHQQIFFYFFYVIFFFLFSSLLLGNCSTQCWVCWFHFSFSWLLLVNTGKGMGCLDVVCLAAYTCVHKIMKGWWTGELKFP